MLIKNEYYLFWIYCPGALARHDEPMPEQQLIVIAGSKPSSSRHGHPEPS